MKNTESYAFHCLSKHEHVRRYETMYETGTLRTKCGNKRQGYPEKSWPALHAHHAKGRAYFTHITSS